MWSSLTLHVKWHEYTYINWFDFKQNKKKNIFTLSVGELLSESVSSDDQHPLDPPEQHYVIAFQLDKGMLANNLPFDTFPLIINEIKAAKTNI